MKRFEFDAAPGTKYWTLTVIYDLNRHNWGDPDKELKEVLGHPDGSGTGFGERDMDWSFVDEKSANEARRRVLEVIAQRAGFKVYLAEIKFEE